MTKLDLGCGDERYPGYVGVDFDAMWKPDVIADFETLPFPDASVEAIYASHVLEHVRFDSPALAEWKRVLEPGGLLTVAVPDVLQVYYLCKHGGLWGRPPGREMDLRYLNATVFGANLLADGDPELAKMYGGPGHEHKQFFFIDMLAERVREAGFEQVREVTGCEVRSAVQGETMVQGRKPGHTKE
jgi:ubiquinone/menaquinone biosynthesis C-methylase UbiE